SWKGGQQKPSRNATFRIFSKIGHKLINLKLFAAQPDDLCTWQLAVVHKTLKGAFCSKYLQRPEKRNCIGRGRRGRFRQSRGQRRAANNQGNRYVNVAKMAWAV